MAESRCGTSHVVARLNPGVDVHPDDFGDVLAAVRRLVRNEVVPSEHEIEETDRIPARLRERAVAMGLFGYALPEEYGGLGLNMSEQVRLLMELGWTAPAFRSMVSTNNGIAGQILVNAGTTAQKEAFLPRLASGEMVASFALTEADAGSDPSGIRSRAVRECDSYVITGQKRFISNANSSDLLMVFARIGDLDEGAGNISVFVVPTTADGVMVGPKDAKMGQRGSETSEVVLDEVRVPLDALVGEVEGEGFATAMQSLAQGRIHVSAVSVGLASRLIEEMLRHSTSSSQGGRKLAEYQLVQAMLAESQTEAMAGRALVLDAAARWDEGRDRRLAPSAAKLFCTEMVDRVADRAVQVHGGMGYMHEVPVERFYRDARLFRLYEGTSEIQKLIISKQLIREFGT
jgi:acyl-CoA dehydrogenase